MGTKTPQEWHIESLIKIVENKDEFIGNFTEDEAYTYVLSSFADKYSNSFIWNEDDVKPKVSRVTAFNSNIFNMYWGSFVPNHYDIIYNTIIVSKNAYDFLKHPKQNNDITCSDARKKIKAKLHLEHLTPMSYSWKKILKLDNITENAVKNCFKYSVVILITKEESKHLDKNAIITVDDINVLKDLKENHSEIDQTEIDEAEEIKIKKAKLKDNGNGLLRLIHLYNRGVVFVNSKGEKIKNIQELYERLVNNSFTVNQYKDK